MKSANDLKVSIRHFLPQRDAPELLSEFLKPRYGTRCYIRREDNVLGCGWAIFNPLDRAFIKKRGIQIAFGRALKDAIRRGVLTDDEIDWLLEKREEGK